MVTAAKPNPPRQISVTTLNASNYTYLVKWTPPVVSSSSVLANIGYKVQVVYLAQEGELTLCSMFTVIREDSVIFDAKGSTGLHNCVMCSNKYICTSELLATVNISVAAFYLNTPFVASDSTTSCFSVSEGE